MQKDVRMSVGDVVEKASFARERRRVNYDEGKWR